MNLIVGATGMLGGEICRLLLEQGQAVRALVRETSNSEKVARLRGLGAEVVRGDLKDRASLEAACRRASAVISTASSTLSRQEGDSIESVDRQGQLNLIEAAEAAGVKHFVLISFPSIDISFPLQSAKRAVEDRLRRGRMMYTILQPTFFTEVWLSPALGFDPAHATAQIYGGGHNKISWISFQDVAKFAVTALGDERGHQTRWSGRIESTGSRALGRAGSGQESRRPTCARRSPPSATRRSTRPPAAVVCWVDASLCARRGHRHGGRSPRTSSAALEVSP
jgi:uncharacterized protein YbjT (DUF2867 family)